MFPSEEVFTINRFKRVLLENEKEKEDKVSPKEVTQVSQTQEPKKTINAPLTPDWQKVLTATGELYGRGSLYSVLNFLAKEGAALTMRQSGYFLSQGQMRGKEWLDVRESMLIPFRTEIRIVFRYAAYGYFALKSGYLDGEVIIVAKKTYLVSDRAARKHVVYSAEEVKVLGADGGVDKDGIRLLHEGKRIGGELKQMIIEI